MGNVRGKIRALSLAVAAALGFSFCMVGISRAGVSDFLPGELHGFADVRGGLRTQTDPHEGDTSLAEGRLQLDLMHVGDLVTLQLRADFLYDNATEETNGDLESGAGTIDLREVNALVSPLDFMDIKLGRQVLTWGTGDLVFINDLFPKDWQSFFLGRDDEYLKAPSDALLISLFPGAFSIDLAYSPQFDPDRYVRGERLSYWNPYLGARAGRNAVIVPDMPDDWFSDDEIALRVSGTLTGYEWAFYGYDGFWKSPEGTDSATMVATFPELTVVGASLRGALGKGLLNLETGGYFSRDDADGDDAFIPNSQWRFLLGYEREIGRDLTAAMQYYVEVLQNYEAYEDSIDALGMGIEKRDQARHTTTLRLTKQLLNQNLSLSLFVRYSPSDADLYVRPTIKYKLSDDWLLTAGANIFSGRDDHTFLGQFEKNTNLYIGARYSF